MQPQQNASPLHRATPATPPSPRHAEHDEHDEHDEHEQNSSATNTEQRNGSERRGGRRIDCTARTASGGEPPDVMMADDARDGRHHATPR